MKHDTREAAPILVVDDSATARQGLVAMLEDAGHPTVSASTAAEARRVAALEEPAMAVLDLVLPDGDGISLLDELSATWPGMPAVIVTGYVEPRSIVEAMRRGAVEYLAKPVDSDVLVSIVRQALARRRRCDDSRVATGEPVPLIGESAATIELRETVAALARTRLRGALIVGEDGAGKTRVARALHAAGPRAGRPCLFHPCSDGAGTEQALFGVPGSTGAAAHPAGGLLAVAQGGTVVLDDVESLDAGIQLRLLEWAERGTPAPPLVIGLTTEQDAATPLVAWLGRTTLVVPPLRERPRDVAPLARHFLALAAARRGGASGAARPPLAGLSRAAEQRLLGHSWPGNVRELADTVCRAARLVVGGELGPEHFAAALDPAQSSRWLATGEPRPLREIEDAYIDHVLAVTGGNKTRAARLLGIARETLRLRAQDREAQGRDVASPGRDFTGPGRDREAVRERDDSGREHGSHGRDPAPHGRERAPLGREATS
jgi:DNA-binding NtrC family response regulator